MRATVSQSTLGEPDWAKPMMRDEDQGGDEGFAGEGHAGLLADWVETPSFIPFRIGFQIELTFFSLLQMGARGKREGQINAARSIRN